MILLLKAVLKAKKHLSLFFTAILLLIGCTIADQMEMISIGVMADSGVDFFQLFSEKDGVSKDQIDMKWKEIDTSGSGLITKADAKSYIAKTSSDHTLKGLFSYVESFFGTGPSKLKRVIIALLCVGMFKAIFLFFSRYITRIFAVKVCQDLRDAYFVHIQSMSMRFFQKYDMGALSSRVLTDSSQIALSFNSWVTNYIQLPFIFVTTMVFCFYTSWKLSLIIFLGVPFIIVPVLFITHQLKKLTRLMQKSQDKFASVLLDFLAGMQTVKIFSMERFAINKYKKQNQKMVDLECKSHVYDVLTRPILHFTVTFCLVSILVVGLYYLKMDLAELITFCGFLFLFYEPIRKFADENANVQRGVVAAERLFEILNVEPEVKDSPNATPIKDFRKDLVFQSVWFSYIEESPVLKNLSFSVEKGKTLAIVGPTGAGKSTILGLIPRLYDASKGEILIDGMPTSRYTQDSLRKLIAYVPQKPFLFYDTVRSNLTYDLDVSYEEMIEAAKKAHAHEFIEKLPEGYDTHLAEMSKSLSGGQAQRIAIARALLRKSPILLLDEATSSLDAVSERKIQSAIVDLRGSITQIIVAHRLSTIEHADKILFIDHGERVAMGTREQLLETCAPFRAMWEASKLTAIVV